MFSHIKLGLALLGGTRALDPPGYGLAPGTLRVLGGGRGCPGSKCCHGSPHVPASQGPRLRMAPGEEERGCDLWSFLPWWESKIGTR